MTILPAAELREIRELQTYGAVVIGVVVVAAGACAWFLAGRVLRPVRELTETARSISESDQTERIRVSRSGEAAEMAETFNAMLDRLNAASANQRDFLRAAGHELRAPLTVATGHLELLAEGTVEEQTTLPLVIDELTRMGKIIDDLQSLTGAAAPGLPRPGADRRRAVRPRAARQGDGPGATRSGAWTRPRPGRSWPTDSGSPKPCSTSPTTPSSTPRPGTRSRSAWRSPTTRSDCGCATPASASRPATPSASSSGSPAATGANRRYRGAGLGLSIVAVHRRGPRWAGRAREPPGSGATFTIVDPVDAPGSTEERCRGS